VDWTSPPTVKMFECPKELFDLIIWNCGLDLSITPLGHGPWQLVKCEVFQLASHHFHNNRKKKKEEILEIIPKKKT
jgi:hypothetical protein